MKRHLIEDSLQQFVGTIEQIPPSFSAVRVNGKRAYQMARKGQDIELKPKKLTIDEIELLDCNLPNQTRIRVVCSKGTYIRALARDIGAALHSGAYLTDLCRTRIGQYKLEDCMEITEFDDWLNKQTIEIENDNDTKTKS